MNRKLGEVGGNKSEIDYLMKQNLELELEIKYKNQEVGKLKILQEEFENVRCRADIQERNNREI